jgi:predicted transcriptional regulator
MSKSEHSPLRKNELEIVQLTLNGESQLSISKQLGLSPSAVCRTLQRPHVREKIQSSTQELHSPIYHKIMNNYMKAQERVESELDTMDIKDVLRYLSLAKPLISQIIIDSAREDLKKIHEDNEGPVTVEVKYSDTDQTIKQEALKLVQEWGYDEPPKDIVN